MNIPELDELTGEPVGKCMMEMDWYSEDSILHYDIGERSETYHQMNKLSSKGILDTVMDYITDGDLSEVKEIRGTRWAQRLYDKAAEKIDEDTEELVFHHENSIRRLEDPTPEAVLSETYNHYMNTGDLDDDFAMGVSSVAITSGILSGGGVELTY